MSGPAEDDKTIISTPANPLLPAHVRRCPKCGLEVSLSTKVCPVDNAAIFEAPGTVLAESYEFISVSGWGGMSVIYKARNRQTNQIVAIKMLHSLLMTDQVLKRFDQEVKAIMSLRHPNIISVHDFGVSDHGQPYMVMDFIDGQTLADLIRESGGLSLEASLPRFIQLCDALDHAHAVGVLHRDLKPSNVMISSREGTFEDARIVDFGIAKLMDKDGEESDVGHLTRTGELFGSPLYMSPEQCRGGHVDARTDIYSMGCVMYETLTGRPPIKGATVVETLMMQVSEVPPSLSEASGGKQFSRQLEEIIAKTLSKSAEDRYQTMRDLVLALMSVQVGKNLKQTWVPTGISRRRTSVPRFVYITAGSFVVVSILLGILLQAQRLQKTDRETALLTSEAAQSAKQSELERTFAAHSIEQLLKLDRSLITDEILQHNCSRFDLQLDELDLNDTGITDDGTRFLVDQRSLKRVFLDRTATSDGSFRTLWRLPSLQKLSMNFTNVSDLALVNQPTGPSNLFGVYLIGTHKIGDRMLDAITMLPKLQELNVTDTFVTDVGCRVLHRTNLSKLWIANTKFGDEGMRSLVKTANLTAFYCAHTKITDSGLQALSSAPELIELDVSHTGVTDKGALLLARYPRLKTLRMTGLQMTDTGGEVFARMPDLERLNLDSTQVGDKTVAHLSKLEHLRELNLSSTPISDAALEWLSKASSLNQLVLTNTKVTDKGLKYLENSKSLRTLLLLDCPNVSLRAMESLKTRCRDCHVYVLEGTGTF